MRRRLAPLLLLLPLACSTPVTGAPPGPAPAPRVVFTSALDDEDEPTDRLLRASFRQEKLYLWIHWFDLDPAAHLYRYEVVDGSGRVVRVGEIDMSPGDAITWHGHTLSPVLEAPGVWRFRIYIDGRLRIEPSLEVAAQ